MVKMMIASNYERATDFVNFDCWLKSELRKIQKLGKLSKNR